MYKALTWICIISLAYFSIPLSFSQNFDFNPSTNDSSKKSTKMQYPAQRKPLSPDDFKKNVGTLNKQSQNELVQQTNNAIKSMTGKGKRPSNPSESSSTLQEQSLQPKKIEKPPTTTIQQPQQPPPVESNMTPPEGTSTPQEGASLPEAAPSTPESQIYTGFPNATPNGTSNTPAAKKPEENSGWNVPY